MAALRACGAPDTADPKPLAPKGHKKKVYKESVKDLIDAGLLKPGTMLQPLRTGLTQTALVLPDGNLKIGEQVFTAVSPAAMAVSGNKAETVSDLLDAGLLVPGDDLRPVRKTLREASARLRPDGRLELNGGVYGSLSASAVAVSGNKAEPG